MTYLTKVWLHGNEFTGPMPNLSGLSNLNQLSLRDNNLMGIVPLSVVNHPKLAIVNLTNNYLQGPTPKFDTSKVAVDMNKGSNNFCLDKPGTPYDDRVNILLSILEPLGYPAIPTHAWKGNDPCPNIKRWSGIYCDQGNIIFVYMIYWGLSGTISPYFSKFLSLERLYLRNNSLTGTIPNGLTTLSKLKWLDVSHNNLSSKIPHFRPNVRVYIERNPNIGK
ncbi:hypothetical protein Q3G72_015694 [Acer saccharum]|nr:hypothetical protein Q3G72_015694 [Acer saccharum]